MPRRDGSGPAGQGPVTGRGLGVCTGVNSTAYGYGMGFGMGRRAGFGMGSGMGRRAGFGMGSGMGRGAGFGMGFNSFYNVAPTANMSQKEYLTAEMDILKERLEVISSQLENLTEDSK